MKKEHIFRERCTLMRSSRECVSSAVNASINSSLLFPDFILSLFFHSLLTGFYHIIFRFTAEEKFSETASLRETQRNQFIYFICTCNCLLIYKNQKLVSIIFTNSLNVTRFYGFVFFFRVVTQVKYNNDVTSEAKRGLIFAN